MAGKEWLRGECDTHSDGHRNLLTGEACICCDEGAEVGVAKNQYQALGWALLSKLCIGKKVGMMVPETVL